VEVKGRGYPVFCLVRSWCIGGRLGWSEQQQYRQHMRLLLDRCWRVWIHRWLVLLRGGSEARLRGLKITELNASP
jgi:hypothetical protein